MLVGSQSSCRAGKVLTVLAFEYLNVCGVDLVATLLVGALDFARVFEAFALRVVETCLLALVSAIALRLGGILDFV